MRKIRRTELDRLLKNNVCEILFIRRRPERAPGRPFMRKMVCSNCTEILNSENGIRSLNFRLPKGPKQLNEAIHNIVVAWDLFMQDYRNISMDQCFLIQTIPPETFWEYFNKVIYPMSASEKMTYHDTLDELPKNTQTPTKPKRKYGKNR